MWKSGLKLNRLRGNVKNIAQWGRRGDAKIRGKFGEFIFVECHCFTADGWAILALNLTVPMGRWGIYGMDFTCF
jgi:hypothetical protein